MGKLSIWFEGDGRPSYEVLLVKRLERLVRIRKRPRIIGAGAAAERRETLGRSQLYKYKTEYLFDTTIVSVWRRRAMGGFAP